MLALRTRRPWLSLPARSSDVPLSSSRSTRRWPSWTGGARVRSSWSASPASARRACSPSSPRARTAAVPRAAGRASELERELPFGVFVDALDEYVASARAAGARALDDEDARRARPRASRRCPRRGPGGRRPARRALPHAPRRPALLERLAGTRPLVLVLDDLHWADSGSLELLGALLRRPPAAPRADRARAAGPRQVPDRCRRALERAPRAGGARPASSSAR